MCATSGKAVLRVFGPPRLAPHQVFQKVHRIQIPQKKFYLWDLLICLLSLSLPHNSPNSTKSCQVCHMWKRLHPPPYLIVQWYLPATITLFASSHEICGEMQTPGYIRSSYFWEQDSPTHSHFYHQYWCLSFLADTKSYESTLGLCFTMPVTFYFCSYKFCTK